LDSLDNSLHSVKGTLDFHFIRPHPKFDGRLEIGVIVNAKNSRSPNGERFRAKVIRDSFVKADGHSYPPLAARRL
jgi:hypothetical protein